MKNLKIKERQELLETGTTIEFLLKTKLIDNTLTDRFFRFMRSFQWLHNRAQTLRSFGGKHIMYRNTNGQLKSVTWYQFIIKGLPKIQKGILEILNLKNSSDRYTEMIRFEAIVRLLCSSNLASKYWNLSEELIAEQIHTTAILEPQYDEIQWRSELKAVFGSNAITIEANANDY